MDKDKLTRLHGELITIRDNLTRVLNRLHPHDPGDTCAMGLHGKIQPFEAELSEFVRKFSRLIEELFPRNPST